jgi:hypothetical protein
MILRASVKHPKRTFGKGSAGKRRHNKPGIGRPSQLCVEPLEDRHLLASNVLVNDPTLDPPPAALVNFTQSETSMVVFGNTVLVAFNDSGSFVGGASKFTGYSISTDMGNTFTDKGTLPTNPGGDAGDPVLARDNTTGTIYLSTLSFAGNIQVFRSFDGGNTFAAPVNGTPGKTGFQDKEWMGVDNFPGAGQGNVYLVERDFGPGNGIYFFSSTDGGATFGPAGGTLIASGAAGNVQGANVAVGPNHDLYAFYFDERALPETIKMRKSTDFGATFGPEVTVATLGTGPGFNGNLGLPWRSNAFPQVAVNQATGDLYMVYADNPAGVDRADIFLTQSTDGGATWSTPTRVNDDATTRDQFQPSIALSPDGTNIGVFYYDFDAGTNLINYVGRKGTLSGSSVSFDPSFLVSDTSFPPNFGNDAVVNPSYMGDYDEAKADNEFLYAVWGDNRLGTPDVRFSAIRHTFLVDVDIKPGSFPNSISPNSMGVVPVAILGSTAFDVNDVDRNTVTFGPAGAVPVHNPSGHLEDVNNDLIPDLVFHFRQKETGIAPGDTEACIEGKTLSGIDIQGCDSVNTVARLAAVAVRPGDADLNGVFDSADLVQVFRLGEYEDNVPGNSTFAEGDWNADGDFDSSDLVLAFQDNQYEQEFPSYIDLASVTSRRDQEALPNEQGRTVPAETLRSLDEDVERPASFVPLPFDLDLLFAQDDHDLDSPLGLSAHTAIANELFDAVMNDLLQLS